MVGISPHYRSGGRQQGSRTVFGGCLTLSAYFAKSKECVKSGKSVSGFFRLCLKKRVVFFSKKGVLLFLKFKWPKKIAHLDRRSEAYKY